MKYFWHACFDFQTEVVITEVWFYSYKTRILRTQDSNIWYDYYSLYIAVIKYKFVITKKEWIQRWKFKFRKTCQNISINIALETLMPGLTRKYLKFLIKT